MAVEWSKVLFEDDNDIGDVIGDSLILNDLTASLPVFTNGSKALVSNTMTGTGKVVMDTSPTITSPTISGHPVIEGVTPTGATGTGKLVFDTSPTLVTPTIGAASGTSLTLSGLTASLPVFSDGSKNLVSKSVEDTLTALGVGAWTDYSGSSTVTGWQAGLTKLIFYRKMGPLVYVGFTISGTSNSATVTFTLPYEKETFGSDVNACVKTTDNGTTTTTGGLLKISMSTVTIYKDMSSAAWTNSGTKTVEGSFLYMTP